MPAADLATPPTASLLFRTTSVARSAQGSPSHSPRRLKTDPLGDQSTPDLRYKAYKRIVVFCDGTWQDGIAQQQRSRYTNVLRLARSVHHVDKLFQPPVMQVVFYQSGIGSDRNFYSTYIEGTTGDTLADKVEEAYAFIAHNFNPGDEIFLFGFSRGAYTARMIATFIGKIGILDRKDMDSFASIFINFQKLGLCRDQPDKKAKQKILEDLLAPWQSKDSKGHKRASFDKNNFTIKCVGVWDTVGCFGLPEEISLKRKKSNLFGFHDRALGDHVEHAFQALALNEMRLDFDCNKLIQSDAGRDRGQTLKQCWFTGSHSDIGGGYDEHDLSDLTLVWMAAQVGSLLSLDVDYLQQLIRPVAPWGTQQYHDSRTGIFRLAIKIRRILPTSDASTRTHESIHSSVLEQSKIDPTLDATLKKYPSLIAPLTELERQIKENWPYDPTTPEAKQYTAKLRAQATDAGSLTVTKTSWIQTFVRSISFKGSVKSSTEFAEVTRTTQTRTSMTNARTSVSTRRQSVLLVTSPVATSFSDSVTM